MGLDEREMGDIRSVGSGAGTRRLLRTTSIREQWEGRFLRLWEATVKPVLLVFLLLALRFLFSGERKLASFAMGMAQTAASWFIDQSRVRPPPSSAIGDSLL